MISPLFNPHKFQLRTPQVQVNKTEVLDTKCNCVNGKGKCSHKATLMLYAMDNNSVTSGKLCQKRPLWSKICQIWSKFGLELLFKSYTKSVERKTHLGISQRGILILH